MEMNTFGVSLLGLLGGNFFGPHSKNREKMSTCNFLQGLRRENDCQWRGTRRSQKTEFSSSPLCIEFSWERLRETLQKVFKSPML